MLKILSAACANLIIKKKVPKFAFSKERKLLLKNTIDIKCGLILTEKERCCMFAEQLEINILG